MVRFTGSERRTYLGSYLARRRKLRRVAHLIFWPDSLYLSCLPSSLEKKLLLREQALQRGTRFVVVFFLNYSSKRKLQTGPVYCVLCEECVFWAPNCPRRKPWFPRVDWYNFFG